MHDKRCGNCKWAKPGHSELHRLCTFPLPVWLSAAIHGVAGGYGPAPIYSPEEWGAQCATWEPVAKTERGEQDTQP